MGRVYTLYGQRTDIRRYLDSEDGLGPRFTAVTLLRGACE